MTVHEFMELFLEPACQRLAIWDNTKNEIIFKGYLSDIPEDIEDTILYAEITSIDNLMTDKTIVLNIDME